MSVAVLPPSQKSVTGWSWIRMLWMGRSTRPNPSCCRTLWEGSFSMSVSLVRAQYSTVVPHRYPLWSLGHFEPFPRSLLHFHSGPDVRLYRRQHLHPFMALTILALSLLKLHLSIWDSWQWFWTFCHLWSEGQSRRDNQVLSGELEGVGLTVRLRRRGRRKQVAGAVNYLRKFVSRGWRW